MRGPDADVINSGNGVVARPSCATPPGSNRLEVSAQTRDVGNFAVYEACRSSRCFIVPAGVLHDRGDDLRELPFGEVGLLQSALLFDMVEDALFLGWRGGHVDAVEKGVDDDRASPLAERVVQRLLADQLGHEGQHACTQAELFHTLADVRDDVRLDRKEPDPTMGLLGLIGVCAILAMISETRHNFSSAIPMSLS